MWLALAGTSCFVLSIVWYAYTLTTPLGLGSPRAWAAAGYAGLAGQERYGGVKEFEHAVLIE